MADASFVLLDDRGILAVSGPDRRAFLQGLVSNDVDKVGPDRGALCRVADRAGQIPARFHDGRSGRIDLARCRSRAAGRSEAAAVDLPAARQGDARRAARPRRRGGVRRRRARRARPCRASPAPRGRSAAGVAFVDPRLAALGARAILPRDDARAALADAGLAEAGFDAYDRLRLSLGIPDGSRDLVLGEIDPARSRLRRTERRRLAEGLLYRPGADRPHQISRADQEAADAGPDRRAGARRRGRS